MENRKFELISKYKPMGDQINAIKSLSENLNNNRFQTLLGVTGSGKTFTMANIIEKVQKPTLIIAHNKTLAGQLYSEFKEFFPNNRVEYYISYFDYYQPEAYKPQSGVYIEKNATRNLDIEKLRHSTTASLSERNDVIIIASVSCIYGLGDPIDYKNMTLSIRKDDSKSYEYIISKLRQMQYTRNDIDFQRGNFKVIGDTIEIYPANKEETVIRLDFDFDKLTHIYEIEYLTHKKILERDHVLIFPNSHFLANQDKLNTACDLILSELKEQEKYFHENNKFIEEQRIRERTLFDIEMLKETGICQGIENYSRHLSLRKKGEKPYTLFSYLPSDFLLFIDESHVTIPQIRGMYNGDRSRKQTLVDYGFRLPSALDNRPLTFDEFEQNIKNVIFVSATPGEYEKSHSTNVAEQIIRPTGLLDPKVVVKPSQNWMDDLLFEINEVIKKKEKVLITTLTKKSSEDITKYLLNLNIKAKYMHSDIKSLERLKIIRDLRMDKFDVLVGINLLREGLDIPEVSLVAILDSDKEGFLRSETSLIQTIGRAARNKDGKVIMYADIITDSIKKAVDETNRRRKIQEEYNKEHNIVPKTIKKDIRDIISIGKSIDEKLDFDSNEDIQKAIDNLTKKMLDFANELKFEEAMKIRDEIEELEKLLKEGN